MWFLKNRKRPLLPGALWLLVLLSFPAALAPPRTAFAQNAAGELSTQESEPTFKLQVERNLVLVRVVVRDGKGRAVKGLTRENFKLFDNGKLQTISQFTTETPASAASPEASAAAGAEEVRSESELSAAAPRRFLALYFDDVHMPFEEIARVRAAAERYLGSALRVGDRAGIFTASGQGIVDFTSDRPRLEEGLLRLQARPLLVREIHPCPPLFDYEAYLIVHERNAQALETATEQTLRCHNLQSLNSSPQVDAQARVEASAEAEAAAVQRVNQFENETEAVLRQLELLERRMAVLPGQRSIVLVSPGFLTLTQQVRQGELAERALRSKVIINTVDARGLYADLPLGDATQAPVVLPDRPDLMGQEQLFRITQAGRDADPLSGLAVDTGGVYFHNNNDFVQGFQETGNLPEVYYLLAFSPQPFKRDGRFHTLAVKLLVPGSFRVDARRGYFAPREERDAAAHAKEEIRQAIFSQDNLSEIPLEVHTQFYKRDEWNADLAVLARVDLRFIPFHKQDGLNLNQLTVVTVLFDRDGNYLAGKEKRIFFRMRDSTLEKLAQSGLSMRTSFDVKPGTYLVREVVEDAEGAHISGLTRTVEIPY